MIRHDKENTFFTALFLISLGACALSLFFSVLNTGAFHAFALFTMAEMSVPVVYASIGLFRVRKRYGLDWGDA